MRQQYHSRNVGADVHVWNVNKLVAASAHLPVEQVRLADVAEFESAYWFDDKAASCRAVAEHAKLILEADYSYPILLFEDGSLVDGMHRICKAWMEGRDTIGAIRISPTPPPDFINVSLDDLPYD